MLLGRPTFSHGSGGGEIDTEGLAGVRMASLQGSRPGFYERNRMLILKRRLEEAIQIGDDYTVQVLHISPTTVTLGIDAPADVSINRREVWNEIQRDIDAADRLDGTPRRQA